MLWGETCFEVRSGSGCIWEPGDHGVCLGSSRYQGCKTGHGAGFQARTSKEKNCLPPALFGAKNSKRCLVFNNSVSFNKLAGAQYYFGVE